MEKEKILKLLQEVMELDTETLYEDEALSIFRTIGRLEEAEDLSAGLEDYYSK